MYNLPFKVLAIIYLQIGFRFWLNKPLIILKFTSFKNVIPLIIFLGYKVAF